MAGHLDLGNDHDVPFGRILDDITDIVARQILRLSVDQ